MDKIKTIDEAEAQTAASAKLGLKEIRMAMGDEYKPIMTLEEAAKVSRLAKKTLQKKVSEGKFKKSVKRGRPLLFGDSRFGAVQGVPTASSRWRLQ